MTLTEEIQQIETRVNTLKDLYFTTHQLMGMNFTGNWLCGSRGRGKSFAVLDTVLGFQKKYGWENVKCYYMRISDLSIKAMLENKGRKAIDALLVRKYNMEITTKGNTLYNHGHPIIDFYPLVSAGKKGKGVAEYDPDFLNKRPINPKTGKPIKRFVFIIIDEFMMAEGIEKKSVGNPVEQFKIYIENILRDQEKLDYQAVRIFGCANAVSECSDFLAQLYGFIPEKYGIFKLRRKDAIIYNIPNSKAYIEKRKKSYTASIMDYENDSNYTNIIKRDLETLVPKNYRRKTATYILMFSKDSGHWFTVWDGNVISRYSGQNCPTKIPMKRYLDQHFDAVFVADTIAKYDARAYRYTDLISQATFSAELKQIKPK